VEVENFRIETAKCPGACHSLPSIKVLCLLGRKEMSEVPAFSNERQIRMYGHGNKMNKSEGTAEFQAFNSDTAAACRAYAL
jgi:hypothetical protein